MFLHERISNITPKHCHPRACSGIFSRIEYPYAHFPTHRLTALSLFSTMWEGIEHLEEMGFKVLAITGDGTSTNRKFFPMVVMVLVIKPQNRSLQKSDRYTSSLMLHIFSRPPGTVGHILEGNASYGYVCNTLYFDVVCT